MVSGSLNPLVGFFPADSVHRDGQRPSAAELVRERSGSLGTGCEWVKESPEGLCSRARAEPRPQGKQGEEGQVQSLCPQKSFPCCLLQGSSGKQDLPSPQGDKPPESCS